MELPLSEGQDVVSGGFALLDVDHDGDLDLWLTRLLAPAILYRNEGGKLVAGHDAMGIPDLRAFGGALGDCDGDGRVDLLVTGLSGWALVRDTGDGFEEVPDALHFPPDRFASTLFFDADGDGDQDLYAVCYVGAIPGCPDRLLINDGTCHFTDESEARGPLARSIGHAVAAFDPDGDGDTDLVIAQDLGFDLDPDVVLENDGTGHFTDTAAWWGLDHAAFSMSTEVADVDGDGVLDVYKGNICRNPLSKGATGQPFVDVDRALGVSATWFVWDEHDPLALPEWREDDDPPGGVEKYFHEFMPDRPPTDLARCLTSWATEAEDIDADGWNELLVLNGGVFHPYEAFRHPDMLLHRAEGEARFTDLAPLLGLADEGRGKTAAFADLDGDLRIDLVLVNSNADRPEDHPGFVARNQTRGPGHALFVDLRGPGANTQGIGAIVEVRAGDRTQVAYRSFGTSFLAASAAPLHFGLGAATEAEVVVRWPWGGGVDRFPRVAVDRGVLLVHGAGR